MFEAWDEQVEAWVRLVVQTTPSVRDARLVHHGIAQAEEVGCIGSWFVSVLDPGPGEGLARLLGRLGSTTPLDLESLMIVGLGLCEALGHAARFGLHHGDLGTRGVHVTPELDPILLGFPSSPGGPLSASSVPFASPERLLGHPGDSRSDVYSVAALLYTLRTGVPPFGWADHRAREGHFYAAVGRHPQVPPSLMAVLQTAMEKPPRLRYPDVAAFATALSEAYQAASSTWYQEDLASFDDEITDEVVLQDPTVAGASIPALDLDPDTSWEEKAQPPRLPAPGLALYDLDDLELDEPDADDDRTLELGPEMLAELEMEDPGPARSLAARAPRPVTYRQEPDDIALGDAVGADWADDAWGDTLTPAIPREIFEEESLPALLLAALTALLLGMAGAASVVAFLFAQIH